MSPPDFLHVYARTELSENYAIAGLICNLSSNSEDILKSARETFPVIDNPIAPADFTLRFWVDDADVSMPPWPQPYVRGILHRVFAGFDTKSSLLADLQTKRAFGRFSPAMAGDALHWRAFIYPVLMSILAGSLGLVELHASCVAKKGKGLILLGPSRSGKSTLAMALAQAGFQLLSDDRTFCFLHGDKVGAYGLPRPLKLRHEASGWFGEFGDQLPTPGPGGEPVYYWEGESESGPRRGRTCEPKALIFLKQEKDPTFRMTRMHPNESRVRIEADLLAESTDAIEVQARLLNSLTSLPCWELRYNGVPQSVAEQIAAVLGDTNLESAFSGENR